MTYTIIIIYFILPATSQVVTYAWFCQPFDDGAGSTKAFMKIDMLIPCGDKRHEWILTYARIMVSMKIAARRTVACFAAAVRSLSHIVDQYRSV